MHITKTQLKYVCMYRYMFKCTELIEETGIPPGQIFGLARTSSSLGKISTHLTEL